MKKEWKHKIVHGQKTVTRRGKWAKSTVEKLLKVVRKGESVSMQSDWAADTLFAYVRVLEVYWERQLDMQQHDCIAEGRPDLTPLEWCEWYNDGMIVSDLLVIKFEMCCTLLGCGCAACR